MALSIDVLKERAKLYKELPVYVKPRRLSTISTNLTVRKAYELQQQSKFKRAHTRSSIKSNTSEYESVFGIRHSTSSRLSRRSSRLSSDRSDVENDVRTRFQQRSAFPVTIRDRFGSNRDISPKTSGDVRSRRRGSMFITGTKSRINESKFKKRSHSVDEDSRTSRPNAARLWRRASNCMTLPIILLQRRQSKDVKFDNSICYFQKTLLAKFRLAVKLTIFCARNFKQHCLSLANVKARRNNEDEDDEVSVSSVDELDEYIGLRTPQSANGKQDPNQQEVNVDLLDDKFDAFDDVDSGQIDLSRERTDSIDLGNEINDDHVDKAEAQRINEQQDELAPFIRRLHFHEDDNPDLLIDLSKFKANRQLRIPDETKRILSKEVGERTEHEIYSVTVALRNIKSYGEYPNRMQKKIAEVGLYEKYESKRVIVRQNHPATAFYFILSGAVVVMVMDEETKFARPVAHLYKGQTFGVENKLLNENKMDVDQTVHMQSLIWIHVGRKSLNERFQIYIELAIINSSKRNSTVIAKETCEFLSISVQDYHKIFMAGGVKNISDPDQEIFLKSLKCLASWPIHILPQHPNKCQFLFFKNADVIIRDSSISEWIIIVKSGSVQVLKKLRKVDAFGWKKKKQEPVTLADKREVILKQTVFRKILPELQIPLNPDLEDEPVNITSNGRPLPFKHPNDRDDTESVSSSQPSSSRVPNLWPFSVDLSQMESGRYLEDEYRPGMHRKPTETDLKGQARKLKRSLSDRLAMKPRNRSDSIINEEEKELGGFQPHIRTIQEDLDPSAKHRDHDVDESVILNPEFVLVHTLTKGQVFGLSDLIIGDQPSFSVVSKGADCILINKQFYMEHASDKLRNEMRQELCPYPTEEELQQGLQDSVDWHAYRKTMLLKSLSTVGSRRHMRATIRGTKVQEAY